MPESKNDSSVAHRPPNVILLMTDQHRADALSCAGNPIVRTANFDRLAASGVMFDQAYVNCPVCMASRGAIHTGRYPRTIRMPSMGILPPDEVTLAETLKRAGYRTGMFGKLHFTPMVYARHQLHCEYELMDVMPFLKPAGILSAATAAAANDRFKKNYGFDEGYPVCDNSWGHYLDWLTQRSPEHVKHHISENWTSPRDGVGYGYSPPARRMFHPMTSDFFDSHMPAELHPSAFIVEKATEFFRANRDRPFFAHVSFVDPHHPFNAPMGFKDLYKPSDMPVPPEFDRAARYPPDLPAGALSAIARRGAYPNEAFQWALANYYGMISHVDWCVGRMFEELNALGLAENTIIVFIADHGEYAGDHRLLYKGSMLFDCLMRVPLIMSGPGVPARGRRVPAMVQEIDVFPTILSLLGLPIHAGVQGRDISAALRGEELAGCGRVICELEHLPDEQYVDVQAVRTDRWKLIYYPGAKTGMMFDLAEDPGEFRNLFFDPAHASVRHDLMCELLDFSYAAKDPLPLRLSQA